MLEEKCAQLGLPPSFVPSAILVCIDDAAIVAGAQRRLGQIREAEATAARLLVVARRTVRDYPGSAHSYRILSEAYNQIKKNAYQTGDKQLIEEAIIHAIQAAKKALDLDPDRFETKRHLDVLIGQLDAIKAEMKNRDLPAKPTAVH